MQNRNYKITICATNFDVEFATIFLAVPCRAVNVCLADRMLVCERSMNVLLTDVLGTSCPMCMKPEKDTYVITSKVVRIQVGRKTLMY